MCSVIPKLSEVILANYGRSCPALLCMFLPTSNLNNSGSAQQNGKGSSLFSIFPPELSNPSWSLNKV